MTGAGRSLCPFVASFNPLLSSLSGTFLLRGSCFSGALMTRRLGFMRGFPRGGSNGFFPLFGGDGFALRLALRGLGAFRWLGAFRRSWLTGCNLLRPWSGLLGVRFLFLIPAMGIAHSDHSSQNIVPSTRLIHDRIWEHAAIPTHMLKRFSRLAAFVAQPIAGVVCDIQLSIRVRGQTVMTGFVMGPRALYRAVVLGDVKVDRPRAQRRGELFQRVIEQRMILPIVILREHGIFGRIVAEGPSIRTNFSMRLPFQIDETMDGR